MEILLTLWRPYFQLEHFETLSECLSWWYVGQVRTCVMIGQKVGHYVKLKEKLVNSLEAAVFFAYAVWNFVRMFVKSSSSNMGHIKGKSC